MLPVIQVYAGGGLGSHHSYEILQDPVQQVVDVVQFCQCVQRLDIFD